MRPIRRPISGQLDDGGAAQFRGDYPRSITAKAEWLWIDSKFSTVAW
jgi:hypothetical protein